MKGLLLKDILTMKAYWKVYGALAAFYAVLSFSGNSTMFSFMIALFMLILPLSSFSADELARWDKFAISLPGGRRAVVRAKYQFLFLVLAFVFVITLVINLLLALTGRGAFSELAVVSLGGATASLLMNCVLFPFIFRFGSQKSRIILAIIMGAFAAVVTAGAMIFLEHADPLSLSILQRLSPVTIGAAAVVILAAALAISYLISCRIYDKKEF